MKTIFKLTYALAMSVFLWTTAAGQSITDLPKSWNFAVEISGVLCGYSEGTLTTVEKDGQELFYLNENALVKQSALGGNVELTIHNQSYIDTKTELPVSVEISFATTAEVYSFTRFEKGTAFFTNVKGGQLKEIELAADVILENSVFYPHLMKDFIKGIENEKSYRVYDASKGEIVTKNYKRIGKEILELAGKTFNSIVLEELNQDLGTITKLWLNDKNSFPLKINISNRTIYLSDESAKKKIETVNLDGVLFAKVDRLISNIPDISYMKVEAKINSGGEWITLESLNFHGQKFEGTVTNNFIEGIFEIEPIRYKGENAPSFQSKVEDESLIKYIEPESLIESDNPVLVEEARKITEGSKDSWEATVKLSKWVAENIKGAVPGGTSAINTYNTKLGECGSHSRLLAAFCRAVGIPARLSIGCMYTPYLGGSFGQHAWTEVFMGDAGWVAVDATAFEFDFVDAGHIRLGEKTSFNPKEMKIIDYRIGTGDTKMVEVPEQFKDCIGKYLFAERDRVFEVLYQDGSLAVDIPGQQVLALNEPDETGVLYPKMTRQINFSFVKDLYGNVHELKLQQIIPLQKKSELEIGEKNIPETVKPLLGNYLFPQAQVEFKVFYEEGVLAINDPLAKKVIKLQEPNENGIWKDEFNINEVLFEKNAEDEVTGMTIYSNVYMEKQDGF